MHIYSLHVSWGGSHKCLPLTRDTPSHVFQEEKQKPAIAMLNNFNKGRSTNRRKSGYSSTGEGSADCPYISVLQRPFTVVIFHNLSKREVCISSRGIYSMQDIFLSWSSLSGATDCFLFFFLAISCCWWDAHVCLSGKALINSLWSTRRALNRRQANAVSVYTGVPSGPTADQIRLEWAV